MKKLRTSYVFYVTETELNLYAAKHYVGQVPPNYMGSVYFWFNNQLVAIRGSSRLESVCGSRTKKMRSAKERRRM